MAITTVTICDPSTPHNRLRFGHLVPYWLRLLSVKWSFAICIGALAPQAAALQQGTVAIGMFDEVQRFIAAAARCRFPSELKELLSDHARRLGFDYFALVHHVDLRDRAGAVALWSYPAHWAEEYVERRMATSDPVHLASHRTNIGFAWDQIGRFIPLTPAHLRVRERTKRAGLADGFTVPANIPGEANGSCSFAVATGHALPVESLAAAQLAGA